jgi:hypothetical protein
MENRKRHETIISEEGHPPSPFCCLYTTAQREEKHKEMERR